MSNELLDAMRRASETGDPDARRAVSRAFARAEVLVPTRGADGESQVAAVEARDGSPVALAFTDVDAFANWAEGDSSWGSLRGSDLCALVLEQGGTAVIVNPHGPFGGQLGRRELKLVADAGALDLSSSELDPFSAKEFNVERVRDDEGLIEIKRAADRRDEPLPRALIPSTFYGTELQQAALRELAADVVDRGLDGPAPRRAARSILTRELPRTTAVPHGDLLQVGDAELERTSEIAAGLDDSHLFIQGPPGSGKTYTGAQLILSLLARRPPRRSGRQQPQGDPQPPRTRSSSTPARAACASRASRSTRAATRASSPRLESTR